MIALYVETKERDLKVSTVSLTKSESGLVVRKGYEMGNLKDLDLEILSKYPLLIACQGYKARSSAGFVSIWSGNDPLQIAGMAGFPKGLRPLISPIPAVLFPEGTRVVQDGSFGSNPGVRDAWVAGFEMAGLFDGEVAIVEGQSDYAGVWHFYPNTHEELPEIPWEHRAEMFTPESMMETSLKRYKDIFLRNLNIAVDYARIQLGRETVIPGVTPEFISQKYQTLLEEGWKFSIGLELGNHFLGATSPEGETQAFYSLQGDTELEMKFSELSTSMTPEQKDQLARYNLAQHFSHLFWSTWNLSINPDSLDVIIETKAGETRKFSKKEKEGYEHAHRFLSLFDTENFADPLTYQKVTVTATKDGVTETRTWTREDGKIYGAGKPSYMA